MPLPALRRLAALAGSAALLALAGCATAPSHPALQAAASEGRLPPLVPMRRFVADLDFADGHIVSPDGRRLLWRQVVGTDIGLAVRPAPPEDGAAATRRIPTGTLARPGASGATYAWLPDSRHIAYQKDFRGDENTQFFVVDADNPEASPWAVTPWPGVRSTFVSRGAPGSARFFFASNRRERSSMDLYEADAATRTVREVARSDADSRVIGWLIGTDHQLAARWRQLGDEDGRDVAVEVRRPDGEWRRLRTVPAFSFFSIHRIDPAAGRLWAMTNMGRDKVALVELDLSADRETVLAEHAEVDLEGAWFPPAGGAPYAVSALPDLPQMRYLDTGIGAELARAADEARARHWIDAPAVVIRPTSAAQDNQRMVLRATTQTEAVEMLLDRTTGRLERLTPPRRPEPGLFSPMTPFVFTASDGLKVHGYITQPTGVQGPAPTVVAIHGGPWARDSWQLAGYTFTQMLANRGYAVVQVNYRGSAGYGKAFIRAGDGEYNGRMQQDIAEATQWAIDQGIADPKRLAVLGASFGGFSVLAQLIQKRQDWRCGVDMVGVANWPRVIENWPPFWRNRHYFARTFGDVNDPAQRARMLANSPITQIDRIDVPLLVVHGDNDVRVLRQDSDEVVDALRALGRPVTHLRFANEGHQVRHWRNRLAMWRATEDMLASCLGGRSAGFDLFELMPR
ncbi:S9 family peptidase [Pseudacidovorax sp. NFM-22]|uniref:S9 family peptidase n=1 Tax=Pseudacidovorax sp. NFM-22 TaxID=2744469 RepID=UPI001F3D50B6|nr:prolyl oligopeptidase family serine peptidase [Pseudacidovorax sp. NFM-22]